MLDLLCPRHEVEAWVLAEFGVPADMTGAPTFMRKTQHLIARLEARDQALREAAARVAAALETYGAHRRGCWHVEPGGCSCGLYDVIRGLCEACHGAGVHCVAPGETYSDAVCGNCRGTGKTAPLGECPQCRAEVAR